MTNIRKRTLGFILMGIGIAVMAMGVYELARPDEFRSHVVLKLNHPNIGESLDDDGVLLEIEAIVSQSILTNVVHLLELASKWNAKHERGHQLSVSEAARQLEERISIIPQKNTTIVRIFAVSKDADEAASIANAVAKVYGDWRNGKWLHAILTGDEVLTQQIEIEETEIKKGQDRLTRLQRELNIPASEVDSLGIETNSLMYWSAKKKFQELRDLRLLIIGKIKTEQKDLNLPRS